MLTEKDREHMELYWEVLKHLPEDYSFNFDLELGYKLYNLRDITCEAKNFMECFEKHAEKIRVCTGDTNNRISLTGRNTITPTISKDDLHFTLELHDEKSYIIDFCGSSMREFDFISTVIDALKKAGRS